MGSQLSRRFVRAVPGPLSPRPRGHLGWMSFKPAEYPARASPPWVTFRMEAMRSRQAFPTGPGDSGDGCLRGDVPTACGPSLCAGVVLFWGRVPGRGAFSSGSADVQSKRERRPPTRGQSFIWGAVAAARPGPCQSPTRCVPAVLMAPGMVCRSTGVCQTLLGGPWGPPQVCAPHPGLLRGKRASLLLSQGDSAALTAF